MRLLLLIVLVGLLPGLAQAQPVNAEQLRMAAETGDDKAAYTYGAYLRSLQEDSAKPDYKEAAFWLKIAAQQQNPKAILALGELYDAKAIPVEDPNLAKNYFELAFRMLSAEAAAGNGDAALGLGTMYQRGSGVKKSPDTALKWYQKAVELGNPNAKLTIGKLAVWGTTPGYTADQGVALLQDAADEGMVDAWLFLGYAYSGAYGGAANPQRAFYSFLKGAANGDVTAMWQVGVSYLSGIGTARDPGKAAEFMLAAAKGGNAEAMYLYSQMAKTGTGMAASDSTYQTWVSRAAKADQPDALYEVGMRGGGSLNPSLLRAAELKQIRAIPIVKAAQGK